MPLLARRQLVLHLPVLEVIVILQLLKFPRAPLSWKLVYFDSAVSARDYCYILLGIVVDRCYFIREISWDFQHFLLFSLRVADVELALAASLEVREFNS